MNKTGKQQLNKKNTISNTQPKADALNSRWKKDIYSKFIIYYTSHTL